MCEMQPMLLVVRRLRPFVIPVTLGAAIAFAVPLSLARARTADRSLRIKRGIASSRYLRTNPRMLSSIGAAWAYGWSTVPPPSDPKLEWVPMAWGSGSLTPAVLRALRTDARTGRARYLLGFNEPDSASQANMTPDQAARLWPKLERSGLELGSPAPQVPDDGWLARFMTLARRRHLRVDFIALHYYQDFTDPLAVRDLRDQLTRIHGTYGKPIWITEIGAIDLRSWGERMMRPPTDPLADSYMRRLFAMLNALSFVQRYAWFTDDCWNHPACRFGSLFTARGRLTSAGRTFETTAPR